MKFAFLLESSPAEMTEALRWISFLKPYVKRAVTGNTKQHIANMRHAFKKAREMKWAKTGNLIEFLESPWYRVILFIPKDDMSHLLPQSQQELVFHTDDEFNDDRKDYITIDVRPSFDPPINSEVPVPPLAQKYLIQAAIDFREELKSVIEQKGLK